MKTILAATDFSQRSEVALQRAKLLARLMHAKLIVTHVVDDDAPQDWVESQVQFADRTVKEHLKIDDLSDVEIKIVRGDPFAGLYQTALDVKADLIVVGDHRRSILRALFLDTTVERLIRVSTIPVLIARDNRIKPYLHALIGIENENADFLMNTVERLGEATPPSISLLHVFNPIAAHKMIQAGATPEEVKTYKDNLAESERRRIELSCSRAHRLLGERVVVDGDLIAAFENTITRISADLVVSATRARTGIARMVLGSATSRLIREGAFDLLILPPEPTHVG